MQISSSIDQSYLLNEVYRMTGSSGAASTAKQADQVQSNGDSAAISAAAYQISQLSGMPGDMDFENMSNDDLKEYLQKLYEITGMVPGKNGSVEDLTEEDLEDVRTTLVEMLGNNDPTMELASTENTSKVSADDAKAMLMLFMVNLQNSMAMTSKGSSGKEYPGLDTNQMVQLFMNKISASMDEEAATQAQQVASAYERNILSV